MEGRSLGVFSPCYVVAPPCPGTYAHTAICSICASGVLSFSGPHALELW